ncbi:MAG: fumarylacetoacetate hydrolase family protein, partial [Halobacteriales archaeon]|nr:fumarylacetoacetate hydrolase family protein [Halobacteriales archaeon]
TEVEAAVGGMTISIDVSIPSALPARDVDDPSPPFTLHPPAQVYKFAPGFRPVLSEPVSLGISALPDRRVEGIVDGENVTTGSTDDLRFDPLDLVAEVTRYLPLEPGDLVALGEGESPVVQAPCAVTGHLAGIGDLSTTVVTA